MTQKLMTTNSQLASSHTTDYVQTDEAAEIYRLYTTKYGGRFRWIRPDLLCPSLCKDLTGDAHALLKILQQYGIWDAEKDAKLNALEDLLTRSHTQMIKSWFSHNLPIRCVI